MQAELAIAGVGANGAVAGTVAATFALVFVAEWGDKSFFSTIGLSLYLPGACLYPFMYVSDELY